MQTTFELDRPKFLQSFPEQSFTVRHRLADHPLLALPSLVELAQILPERDVEYNAGKLGVNQDPSQTPKTGLSVDETIRRIEECNSWLVLKYVEQDKRYRELLDLCLDEIYPLASQKLSGLDQREAFIFVSSPGAVTPYHMDPEHNFLLQIFGEKTVYMFDGKDRNLVRDEELERFYMGNSHRNMEFHEEFQNKAMAYDLKPGDGLYFPIGDPHWVKVGASYSISLSITFRSDQSQRRARLYQANAYLRRCGLKPGSVGQSEWSDGAKDLTYRVFRKATRMLGMEREERRSY